MRTAKTYPFYTIFILIIIIVFLIMDILEGPIRYFLASKWWTLPPWLIYIPKFLMGISVFLFVFNYIINFKINKITLQFLTILLFYSLVSYIYNKNIYQMLFGIWVFIPLIFGMFTARYSIYFLSLNLGKVFFRILFITVIIGVFLDLIGYDFWMGVAYSYGGVEIEILSGNSILGIDRLSGFSRTSFSTAIQTLFFGLILLYLEKSFFLRIMVWIMTGIIIALTTSKGVVISYLGITLFLVFQRFTPYLLWKYLIVVIVIMGFLLPITAVFHDYSLGFSSGNFLEYFLLASFEARLILTWPETIYYLVDKEINWLTGLGIGAVGSPHLYFSNDLFVLVKLSCDNVYLYSTALFGIGSVVLFFVYVRSLFKLDIQSNNLDRLFYMMALFILTYGVVASNIESGLTAFFVGIIANYIFSLKKVS